MRGIVTIVEALGLVDARLLMAGSFADARTEEIVKTLPGWDRVKYFGQVSRARVQGIMLEAKIGLALFQPVPNHIRARPNKIFEYLGVGLPVLASKFSDWVGEFQHTGAVEFVDPTRSDLVAEQLETMLSDFERLQVQSKRGHASIVKHYSWSTEFEKLLRAYERMLS